MNDSGTASYPKPPWLRKPPCTGPLFGTVAAILRRHRLGTVCTGARCPNRGECFSRGTATFMILGDVCTRDCRFCAVTAGTPCPPDATEPARAARAAAELGLSHVVVTSVTRDDLPDGGAGHFAATIHAVRGSCSDAAVEVLVPDFRGDPAALTTVLDARPGVLNHNVETVPRLYPAVRPAADYRQSLDVLARAAQADSAVVKSGLMLGMGEEAPELVRTLADLRAAGVARLTLGQYLPPSRRHHPAARWVHPDEFAQWRDTALEMGFSAVASGPYVRSSYKAEEMG